MSGLPLRVPLPAVADREFDQLAALTRRVMGVPTAVVSLVDRSCQVFPGAAGLAAPFDELRTTPLSHSFCQHVVRTAAPLVVVDARVTPLVMNNLAIPDLGVIAYAGMPLYDVAGDVIGSLCAFDTSPREWSPAELETLHDLAAACSKQLQLREVTARAAVDADRIRIAGTLHATVVRELFSLSMALGAARSVVRGPGDRELGLAMQELDEILKNVRNAVYEPVA